MGHSMEPTLRAGQFVLVNCWARPKVGDLVVANDAQVSRLIVKRLVKVDGSKLQVAGDNKGHGEVRTINKSQVFGKVIWPSISSSESNL